MVQRSSLRYRSGVQSWCIYQLLLHRRRATDANAAGPERFTWVSRNVKWAGSQRCCVAFRVERWRTLRSAGELRLEVHS